MHIYLNQIIPYPIPAGLIKQSEIWDRELSFLKNNKTLVYAESGKGKTTLINIILGIRNDYSGELLLNNRNINTFSIIELAEIRQKTFSIVPQGLSLFDNLSVWENIQIKNSITGFLEDKEIVNLLEIFNIIDHKDRKTKIISYGQKQRVAIIRALCQPYDFLLMDEPFSHLDETNKSIIWETVNNYADRQGSGIIISSLKDDLKSFITNSIKV